MTTAGVGPLLRDWRGRRRRSQMDLAYAAGVSPKHLSFVETGRAKPSRELLMTLARTLDVPLRDCNALLLAAGYAPQYHQTPIDDPSMQHVRSSLERLLATHDPYPGVVLDRRWDIVLANAAASRLTGGLDADLMSPPVNIFRISMHPRGLAAITRNFDEWASYLLQQLHRLVAITGDESIVSLEREVLAYPNVADLVVRCGRTVAASAFAELLVPCCLVVGGDELSLFTTLTTFGTPRDITLDELAIELFFPADDATDVLLRAVH